MLGQRVLCVFPVRPSHTCLLILSISPHLFHTHPSLTSVLPEFIPGYLEPKARLKWLLAHFTQLALESDNAAAANFSDDRCVCG